MAATATACAVLVGHPVLAQPAPPPASLPATPDAAGPSSLKLPPDQTTAVFGDWTLRCDQRKDLTPPQRVCELGLIVQKDGEAGAVAQIALGRVTRDTALQITAVLPPDVALLSKPKVMIAGQEASAIDLSWTRCIAGGCFAGAPLSPALLNGLRASAAAGRLDYLDGTGRGVTVAVSLRGMVPALDALAREEAN
jgi:invasion protein IalB